jgi:hypothetical protein
MTNSAGRDIWWQTRTAVSGSALQEVPFSYFRDGRLQTTSLSSPQVSIRAPFVDSDNSLLVPSSQGLYRLNHGQVTLFSSDNGLPCPETFQRDQG